MILLLNLLNLENLDLVYMDRIFGVDLTPEQKKIYSRGSLGFGYGWGFDLELNFNKNTSLRSGLNISTYISGSKLL